MSFNPDRSLVEQYEREILQRDPSTAQGGVYAITVNGHIVYIGMTHKGKTSCLAHRFAQHRACTDGYYCANTRGLNMYDCLAYWQRLGLTIATAYTPLETIASEEYRNKNVEPLYLSAFDKDPLSTLEGILIKKYDPVLNIRKPTRFMPNRNRFWDDDFDLVKQLQASEHFWIRDAANVTPKFN